MRTEILDHGYVELIESWGSDERVIESARMSTGKGFLGWGPKCRTCGAAFSEAESTPCPSPSPGEPCVDCGVGGHFFDQPGDEKLLRFLWENKHATPFEMAGATFEVKAPIFVFREWHRHRTQSYNEMSARYVPLPDENYVPTAARVLMVNAGSANKQAAGNGAMLSDADARSWLDDLADVYERAQRVYERGIELGVAKEVARLPIPVARYSRMRASANLRNWLAFLTLRDDDRAQWEIRQFARAVSDALAVSFPRTMALFGERR